MKYGIAFGLLLLAAVLSAETQDDALAVVRRLERQRIALADRLAPTVCAVFKGGGGGSGVIIHEDGLVLSNFHVTGLAAEMRIGLNDNRIHPAAVLGVDPSGDLSLLRLTEKRKWKYATLGDSDALRQGDWVYAMGNPFLLATDFTPTITLGVVSGINRYQPGSMRGSLLYPDCIQTDASINPGNSGGPLFNFAGEVVGINGRVSLRDRGRVNIGVGYAISSNQIKMCLPELRAGKIVQHGTLNATVRTIDDPTWPGGGRITFDQMLVPGAAHSAGIEVGDALIEFMGHRITGSNDFLRRISVLPQGRVVSLKVRRYDGKWKELEFTIKLDGVPLIRKSDADKKQTPKVYIDQEIARTFAAAKNALQPIGNEVHEGVKTVAGRAPRPLSERFVGGVPAAEGAKEDLRNDLIERANAWNDLLAGPDAFESIDFTGGAIVNGITVDRFVVKPKSGGKGRVYYVHLDTGLLHRMDVYSTAWVRWLSIYCTDWRNAGGLNRPYKLTIWDRDKDKLLQTWEYKSIRKS